MATEKEMELAKQILAKLTEMEKKVDKLGDSIKGLETETIGGHTGLKATFEQGFADVHKGLAEIKEVKQMKKKGKQVH
ncbi:chromosome segregation protein SMC (plasmid) [Bacillus mycoides]|uniref:chromosome segregation protein SMC n=1 Tax=Bacillus mycoides TaxID=1405 RepID=UPI001C01E2D4|nr:chromosome segregation protein SMC [Bacillus mycoides]QWH15203.1 chromosome segregation protein SMC [Bacillus mycoides]